MRKNWDDAISAATAAIGDAPLDARSQHAQIWKDQTTAGVIWKMRRETEQIRIGNQFWDIGQKKIMYAPSKELREAFNQASDIRYSTTVLARGSDRFSVGKWLGAAAPGSANEGIADIKVFRTAEMYLIRAEAYAEKGMLTEGAQDLNDLRAARITGYVAQSFSSKEALIDAIILERFKELAFEGHRMGDLRRRGLAVTRLPEDAVNALGAVTLNPTDKEYYYPIPSAEILANANVEQNPAYK